MGAGTGATVGKILNRAGMMKGGIGMATVQVGGDSAMRGRPDRRADGGVFVDVTALTVVNALGDVYDEAGRILAGALRDGRFAGSTDLLLRAPSAPNFFPLENTTLSVVMTDARLDKLQCGIVARMSHDGFARAINPVHTPVDGDCVFVLATGAKYGNVFQIGVAAAEAVALSIRRAVRAAKGADGVPSVSRSGGRRRRVTLRQRDHPEEGERVSETIPCVTTVAEVRRAIGEVRALGATVGMVPTMGALHEGHLSLIRTARAENDTVVVSIFVNPTQFGPNEDLERYPRTLARDCELSQAAGADLIFCPTDEEMYPAGFATWVDVEGLTDGLCGRSRPGHFRGVCTVVTKLLNICAPDRAYFGEKDAQQLAVITRMVRDLDMPIAIVPCATVREADGLAMSSRNVRLTPEETG